MYQYFKGLYTHTFTNTYMYTHSYIYTHTYIYTYIASVLPDAYILTYIHTPLHFYCKRISKVHLLLLSAFKCFICYNQVVLSATWAGRRRIPARRRRQKHRLYKIQPRHVAAFVVAVSWATAVLQAGLLGPVWSLLSWAVLRASDFHAPWRWCVAMTHSLISLPPLVCCQK